MRIGVVSDIHSNLEALEGVRTRALAEGAEAFYVLGDVVGYGADPGAVIEAVRRLPGAQILAGNHDLAATGRFDVSWFNEVAAEAIRWTEAQLSGEAIWFLKLLEPRGEVAGTLLVHGSVVDPAAEYLMPDDDLAAGTSFAADPFATCCFGHTHYPTVFDELGGRVRGRWVSQPETIPLDPDRRYMLNPGSVGQPRDGDPRAAFMILDTAERTATWHRVEYPIEAAQEKIRRAGLPEVLAERLAVGF